MSRELAVRVTEEGPVVASERIEEGAIAPKEIWFYFDVPNEGPYAVSQPKYYSSPYPSRKEMLRDLRAVAVRSATTTLTHAAWPFNIFITQESSIREFEFAPRYLGELICTISLPRIADGLKIGTRLTPDERSRLVSLTSENIDRQITLADHLLESAERALRQPNNNR